MAGQRVKRSLTKRDISSMESQLASFDAEEVFQIVIAGLKRSPQFNSMPQYPERKTFLERVVDTTDDLHGLTRTFSVSLAHEYSKLMGRMKRLRVNDRFSEFQVEWLQLIRTTASTAEMLAFENAQVDVDEGELGYQASAILLEAFDETTVSSALIVYHAIAREVFMYQQSRVVLLKERDSLANDDAESTEGEDTAILAEEEDSLYRVCGAQLHKMKTLRKEKLRGLGADELNAGYLRTEIDFLESITMTKLNKPDQLPPSLMVTERGGRSFPKKELLPFVHKVVQMVKEEITDANFGKYGENIFKVNCCGTFQHAC